MQNFSGGVTGGVLLIVRHQCITHVDVCLVMFPCCRVIMRIDPCYSASPGFEVCLLSGNAGV